MITATDRLNKLNTIKEDEAHSFNMACLRIAEQDRADAGKPQSWESIALSLLMVIGFIGLCVVNYTPAA